MGWEKTGTHKPNPWKRTSQQQNLLKFSHNANAQQGKQVTGLCMHVVSLNKGQANTTVP